MTTETILWLSFILFAGAIVFYCGLGAGMYYGYKRGVREVVLLNDASYRSRLCAETEEMKKRNESAVETVRSINGSQDSLGSLAHAAKSN